MTNKTFAELVLFGTTFIWGSTFIAIKWGLESLSPLLFLAIRFSIAALLFALFFGRSLRTITWSTVKAGALLGCLLCLGFALQTVGLEWTTASKSSFITGLMVVFTPLVHFAMGRSRPTRGNLGGVAVVTLGLWLLTDPTGGSFNRGDVLTLLCAAVFATYIVMLDRLSPDHPVLPLTFVQIAVTALLSWAGAGALETVRVAPTATALWTTAYLAVAATILTGYVMTRYQRDTTPTRAAIIYSVEPVWASAMAALVLGERLTPVGMVGAAIILCGVLLSSLSHPNPLYIQEK